MRAISIGIISLNLMDIGVAVKSTTQSTEQIKVSRTAREGSKRLQITIGSPGLRSRKCVKSVSSKAATTRRRI